MKGTETVLIEGEYTLKVVVNGRASNLEIHLPLPVNYSGCTTIQRVLHTEIDINPHPDEKKIITDSLNRFQYCRFKRIKNEFITINVHFCVERTTNLVQLPDDPIRGTPKGYEKDLKELSRRLSMGKRSIHELVDEVVFYISNNIQYQYDGSDNAGQTLRNLAGNCMGISELAVSLLMASGVKARLVAGITIQDNYVYSYSDGEFIYRFKNLSFEGLHQWCEVYLPSCGWCETEPQGRSCFVPSGYVRLSTGKEGVDYPELISYSYMFKKPVIKYSINTGGTITRKIAGLHVQELKRRGSSIVMFME